MEKFTNQENKFISSLVDKLKEDLVYYREFIRKSAEDNSDNKYPEFTEEDHAFILSSLVTKKQKEKSLLLNRLDDLCGQHVDDINECLNLVEGDEEKTETVKSLINLVQLYDQAINQLSQSLKDGDSEYFEKEDIEAILTDEEITPVKLASWLFSYRSRSLDRVYGAISDDVVELKDDFNIDINNNMNRENSILYNNNEEENNSPYGFDKDNMWGGYENKSGIESHLDSYNQQINKLKEEIRALESSGTLTVKVKGVDVGINAESLILAKEEEIREIERKRDSLAGRQFETKTEEDTNQENNESEKKEEDKPEDLADHIERVKREEVVPEQEENPEVKAGFVDNVKKTKSKFDAIFGPKLRWLRERKKGLMTFGYWEVRQAEKLRTASNQVDRDVKSLSRAFHQENSNLLTEQERERDESNVNLKLAELIQSGEKIITASGEEKTITELSPEEKQLLLDRARFTVSWDKFEQNEETEDQIVEKAINTLKSKLETKLGRFNLSAKTFEGDKVLTPDRIKQLERELRKSIGALRTSRVDKDVLKFNKLVRKNLDPNWYKRYVAGGVEAALAFGALYYWVAPNISKNAFSWWYGNGDPTPSSSLLSGVESVNNPTDGSSLLSGVESVNNPVGGTTIEAMTPPVEDLVGGFDVTMDKTVWHSTLDFLSQRGLDVSSLAEADKLELVKKAAESNNIGVKVWGLEGNILDTNMQKGFGLNMKAVYELALSKGLL